MSLKRAFFVLYAVVHVAAAQGLAQAAQPVLPDIQGRLVGIRFFTSHGNVPSRATRIYSNRFEASAIQYLNIELEFEFPSPGKVVTFPVACQYLKPDGSVVGTVELNFQAQADWGGVINAAGWGNVDGGVYAPGIYRARCTRGTTWIGEASFEVFQPEPEIAAANAKFTGIRFFETPRQMLLLKDRKYDHSFTVAQTRSIGVELSFDGPAPGKEVSFTVNCRMWDPTGADFGKFDIGYTWQPDWKGVINANVWGYEDAGRWPKGVFTTSCSSGGRWIADGRFEITGQ
jgi:hypothetical protein